MHCYLAVATPKGGDDRRCSDSTDVLTSLAQWCLSLFNVLVIALLVVIETLFQPALILQHAVQQLLFATLQHGVSISNVVVPSLPAKTPFYIVFIL